MISGLNNITYRAHLEESTPVGHPNLEEPDFTCLLGLVITKFTPPTIGYAIKLFPIRKFVGKFTNLSNSVGCGKFGFTSAGEISTGSVVLGYPGFHPGCYLPTIPPLPITQ